MLKLLLYLWALPHLGRIYTSIPSWEFGNVTLPERTSTCVYISFIVFIGCLRCFSESCRPKHPDWDPSNYCCSPSDSGHGIPSDRGLEFSAAGCMPGQYITFKTLGLHTSPLPGQLEVQRLFFFTLSSCSCTILNVNATLNAFVGKSLGPRLFQMLQSLLYFSPYAFALQLSSPLSYMSYFLHSSGKIHNISSTVWIQTTSSVCRWELLAQIDPKSLGPDSLVSDWVGSAVWQVWTPRKAMVTRKTAAKVYPKHWVQASPDTNLRCLEKRGSTQPPTAQVWPAIEDQSQAIFVAAAVQPLGNWSSHSRCKLGSRCEYLSRSNTVLQHLWALQRKNSMYLNVRVLQSLSLLWQGIRSFYQPSFESGVFADSPLLQKPESYPNLHAMSGSSLAHSGVGKLYKNVTPTGDLLNRSWRSDLSPGSSRMWQKCPRFSNPSKRI